MYIGYKGSDFTVRVKNHLSNVKESDVLAYSIADHAYKLEKGKYRSNYYSHVFNEKICHMDISGKKYCAYSYLPIYRDQIVEYILERQNDKGKGVETIKLHEGQRNLNSSQGLVINFLVPIILEGFENIYTKYIFGHEGKIVIEHSMNDDGGSRRGTEVDFSILDTDGRLHLYEAKYTENSFGGVSINQMNGLAQLKYDVEKYRAKWSGKRSPDCYHQNINIDQERVKYSLVEELIPHITCDRYDENYIIHMKKDNEFTFFDNYQLVRNLYNTFFVLDDKIIKRDNIGTMNVLISKYHLDQRSEFDLFKNQLAFEIKNNNIINMNFWEDACDKAIELSKNNDKLHKHFLMFKQVFLDFSKNDYSKYVISRRISDIEEILERTNVVNIDWYDIESVAIANRNQVSLFRYTEIDSLMKNFRDDILGKELIEKMILVVYKNNDSLVTINHIIEYINHEFPGIEIIYGLSSWTDKFNIKLIL